VNAMTIPQLRAAAGQFDPPMMFPRSTRKAEMVRLVKGWIAEHNTSPPQSVSLSSSEMPDEPHDAPIDASVMTRKTRSWWSMVSNAAGAAAASSWKHTRAAASKQGSRAWQYAKRKSSNAATAAWRVGSRKARDWASAAGSSVKHAAHRAARSAKAHIARKLRNAADTLNRD